jgi:hypothetical protein
VTLSAALAADLAMLTEALDEPGSDIERTLAQLAADAAAATPAFGGLTAAVRAGGQWMTITSLIDSVTIADIVTSLRIPLDVQGAPPDAYVIMYATRTGALVDLAADLSWLTGRPLHAFVAEEDVAELPGLLMTEGLAARRTVDQALGVLIAEGCTLDEARTELDSRATRAGVDRGAAARIILDVLACGSSD